MPTSAPLARFTALLHHLTLERLQAAFMRLKPKAAAGVDGIRWNEYAIGLEGNLQALHALLHRGSYRAKPSRRIYIPKADGKERPLGIASLVDKILQGAVVELLNAVYEADFLGFSYGFRPGRSPHQALDALVVALRRKKVNWVLDADIRRFFDTIDHGWMKQFVQHRIGDQRMLRLIGKWLKAGVMDANQWQPTEEGTPQGASPMPAPMRGELASSKSYVRVWPGGSAQKYRPLFKSCATGVSSASPSKARGCKAYCGAYTATMPCQAINAHLAVSVWRSPNAGIAVSAVAATNAGWTGDESPCQTLAATAQNPTFLA
jgi:hypothetical protein